MKTVDRQGIGHINRIIMLSELIIIAVFLITVQLIFKVTF